MELYNSCIKRKAEDLNLQYKMVKAAITAVANSLLGNESPKDFINLSKVNESGEIIENKKEKKDNKKGYYHMGIAADHELKNPHIKIFDSTKEGSKEGE